MAKRPTKKRKADAVNAPERDDVALKFAGPVTLEPIATYRLVQLEGTLDEVAQQAAAGIQGAFVKLAPTARLSELQAFDKAALERSVMAQGAVGCKWAPVVLPDVVQLADQPVAIEGRTVREQVGDWIRRHALPGTPDDVMQEAAEVAFGAMDMVRL